MDLPRRTARVLLGVLAMYVASAASVASAQDTAPDFGGATIPDQTYIVGERITTLTLPEATDGNGYLSYTLTPEVRAAVSGLGFSSYFRILFGTPTSVTDAVTLTYTVHDRDGNTDTLTFSVTVRVPPVLISMTRLTVPEGRARTYRVWLTSNPNGDVTVTPSVAPGGHDLTLSRNGVSLLSGGAVSATAALTFTTANWNSAQTVTVTAAAGIDNGTATISHTVSGTGAYTTTPRMTVTIESDTVPTFGGATIPDQTYFAGERITSLDLPEATGGNGVLSYTLTPDVRGNVLPGLRSGGITNGRRLIGLYLSGTPRSVADAVMLTYTVRDAHGDTDTLTFSVTVRVPPVLISTIRLTVPEGRARTYRVWLTSNPNGDVTVTPSVAPGGHNLTLSRNGVSLLSGGAVSATAALTFTTANWNSAQTVTVAAAADGDGVDDIAIISHAVSGAGAYTTTPRMTVTIEPDTAPTFGGATIPDQTYFVGERITNFTLPVATGGNEVLSYTLTPSVRNVVFGLRALRTTNGIRLIAFHLSGTPERVSDAVTLTYTARDEDGETDALTFSITVREPRVRISTNRLTVPVGRTRTYSVTLPTNPGVDVTVTPSVAPRGHDLTLSRNGVSLLSGGAVSATAALTFTTANWGIAQTVTVAAGIDNGAATISHAVSGYDDYTAADPVIVTIEPDTPLGFAAGAAIPDQTYTAGETITDFTLPRATGGNGDLTYTLTPFLGSAVPGLRSSDSATGFRLFGAPRNVADAVTLTYTVRDADGNTDTLTFSVTVRLSARSGVIILPTTLRVSEGRIRTYRVWLTTYPYGEVTVTPSVAPDGHDLTLTPSGALTFTSANWHIGQLVSITAVADSDGVDDTATISHAVSGYGFVTTADPVIVTIGLDTVPTFGGATIPDQTYFVGERITDLILPAATGGNGSLSYSVDPRYAVRGLSVQPGTRVLYGTPVWATRASTFTYTVRDAHGDTDTLTFRVTVLALPPPVRISPTTLAVPEDRTRAYHVWLTSNPYGEVTVTPSVAPDGHDLTLTPSALTFTAANWQSRQLVSITAVADSDGVDDTATISHAVSSYGVTTADPVIVNIVYIESNIAPTFDGVTIPDQTYFAAERTSLTLPAATGGNGALSYALTPRYNLPLYFNSHPNARVLSGTPSRVADAVTLTYTVRDADGDTDTLTFRVTVLAPPVLIAKRFYLDQYLSRYSSALLVGRTNTYPVVLTRDPGGEVVITPRVAPQGHGLILTPSALTFTSANWSIVQTVSIFAIADDDNIGNRATISHAVSGFGDYTTTQSVAMQIVRDTSPYFPDGVTIPDQTYFVGDGIALLTLPFASGGNGYVSYTVTPLNLDSGASYNEIAVPGIQTTTIFPVPVSPDFLYGVPERAADAVTLTYTARDEQGDTASLTFSITVLEPPARIRPPYLYLYVPEDRTHRYSVVLTSNPGGEAVVITPSIEPVGHDLTLRRNGVPLSSSGALTFTSANWNTPQSVTVTAVADTDGVYDIATISHAVSGHDYYTPPPVRVRIADDTAPAFAEYVAIPDQTYFVGEEITALTLPVASGGNSKLSYALTPDVETAVLGLRFDSYRLRRLLSGTPSRVADAVTLTYTARDSDGDTDTLTFSITVQALPPVRISPTTLTVSEGDSRAYSVALTTDLGGEVTITPSIAPGGHDLTLMPDGALTFTTANWNIAQMVTVVAAEDGDSDNDIATLSHVGSGAGFFVARPFAVTVTDNDTDTAPDFSAAVAPGDQTYFAGVAITDLILPPAAGGNGILTYALTPDVASAVPGLTFDTDTRVLSGMPSAAASAVTLTYTASDADADADTDTLTFSITVNPAVVYMPSALTVTEGTSTGTYTVELSVAPDDGDVTVTPSGGGLTLSPAALTFTGSNWSTAQNITITAAPDDDADNETIAVSHAVSGAGNYSGLTDGGDVTVTVTDSDPRGVSETRGVTLSATPVLVTEGETATYGVVLDMQPNGNVTVTPDSGDDAVATVSAALVFTSANWNTAQSVTVTGTEDADTETDSTTITHTVTGADYADVTVTADPVTVTVTDDDTRGVTFTPDELPVGEGTTGAYTVELDTPPSGTVRVTPSVNGGDHGVSIPTPSGALVFDSNNWNTAQTVSVFAAEDDADFANETATISHTVIGYTGVTSADDVVVTVTDNDTDEAPTFGTLTQPDQTYTVGDTVAVALPIATGGNGTLIYALTPDLSAIVSGLSFDDTTRVLSGTADALTAAITLTYTAADSDANTDTADTASLTFTVTVNPVPAALVFDPTALTVTEGTSTGAYAVELSVAPDGGDVTVTPSATRLTFAPAALTFTTGNWNTAQNITITAAQDNDTDNETVAVSHAVSGAGNYATLTDGGDVTVTVTETPAVTIAPDELTVDEGNDDTYTVALTAPPSAGSVVVTPKSDDTAAVTVSPSAGLTFDAVNWNIAQSATVSAVADFNTMGDTATIIHTVTVTVGGAAEYDGIATESVTVEVTDTSVQGIALSPATLTVDEGATGAYGVRLETIPDGGDVTVTLSLAGGDATFAPTADLTFSATTWNISQSVTVTPAADDDAVANTDVTIAHSASGADYDGVSDRNVRVVVTETNTRGVTISETSVEITEGRSAIYTVALTSAPDGGNVTVMPTSDDAAVVVSDALTFTGADWNEAQTVIVTATTDDDTENETATITHTVDGADYGGVTADDVVVTVTDDDTPGVTISTDALTVDEGGSAAYTVRLDTIPSGEVTITTDGNHPDFVPVIGGNAIRPGGLTFTPTNWNEAQTFTVFLPDYFVSYGINDISISHEATGAAEYDGISIGNVSLTKTDMRGVTISEMSVEITEGGSATYTVVLDTAPDNFFRVTVTPDIPAGADLTRIPSGALTFHYSNWSVAQTVTLIAAEDDDAVADPLVTITHTVTGADYDSPWTGLDRVLAADVTATITENDSVGITVTETTLTVNEGEFDSYTVVLTSAPSAGEVTVTLSSADTGAVSVLAASWFETDTLVFNAFTWDYPRAVNVTGVADADAVDESVVISNAVTVSDSSSDYVNETADNVTVTVDDSGTAAVTISTPTLTVAEDGEGIYTVALGSAPGGGGNATVTPTSADTAIATVSGALTFSATSWNDMQTVTVRGVADADTGDEMVSITHTVSGYAATADAVDVTVTDTSVRGVTVPTTPVSVTEGTTGNYTVVLDTQPSGNVTVTPDSEDDDVATVSGALTFTNSNWNIAQTVTVTGTEDADSANESTSITHAVSGADYDGVTAANVAVTVNDDEIADTSVPVFEVSSLPDRTYTVDTQIIDLPLPAVTLATGDGIIIYTLTPTSDIPAGLSFDDTTRVLSGTPDTVAAAVTLTYTAADSDINTDAADTASLTFAVTVNPAPAVLISETTLTIDEGVSGIYTVTLATAPGGNVTVTPTSSDTGEVPTPSALTFAAAEWNTAQTVTLTAATDSDATDDTATISHMVAGYGTVTTAEAVVVTVTDSNPPAFDTAAAVVHTFPPGAAIAPTVLPAATGGRGMLAYTLTPDSAIPSGLSFTAATRTVSGTPAAGAVAATLTYTATDSAGATATRPVVLVVGSQILSGFAQAALTNSGDNALTLLLDGAPASDVTVGVEVQLFPGSAPANYRFGPGILTFTPANWNIPQTVTTAIDGFSSANAGQYVATIQARIGSRDIFSGAAFHSVFAEYNAIAAPDTLSVDEGGTGFYTVVLEPLSPAAGQIVTVTPTSADDTVAGVSGALTFTDADWNVPKMVTVTGVVDDDSADDPPVSITHQVTFTGDDTYLRATTNTVTVTVTDIDAEAFIGGADASAVEGTTLNVPVEIRGPARTAASTVSFRFTGTATTADYEVVTQATPAGSVITFDPAAETGSIELSAAQSSRDLVVRLLDDSIADAGETFVVTLTGHSGNGGAGGPAHTFAPAARTVTLADALAFATTVDDQTYNLTVDVSETLPEATGGIGNITYALTPTSGIPAGLSFIATSRELRGTPTAVAPATPLTYTATDTDNVSVSQTFTVTVNPAPAVLFAPTTLTVTEDTSTGAYAIELSVAPTSGEVTVTPDATTGLTFAPAALTFSATSWNTAQDIVITAAPDDDTLNETVTVSHTVVGAGNYAALSTAAGGDVTVTVTDTSIPAVTIIPLDLTVNEGGNRAYTVQLATEPAAGAQVMVTPTVEGDLASHGVSIVLNTALTFDAGNWNTAQEVVVSAAQDDLDFADSTATISHAVAGYTGVTGAADVVVTVDDNDIDSAPAFASGESVPAQGYTENTPITALVLPAVAPAPATQGNGDITYALTPIPSGLNFDATTRILSGTPGAVTTATTTTLTYTAADEDGNTDTADTASLTFVVTVSPATPAALVFAPTALSVDEDATGGYTVELSVAPTSGEVTVTPDATTGLTFAPAALTFSATSWNTAQDIVITAAPDDDTLNETVTVSHTVVGAGNYDALTAGGDVTVTVTDTSIPAVTITSTDLTVDEGSDNTYTVELATEPDAGAQVMVTPTVEGDLANHGVSIAPNTVLVFDSSNWNTAQSVVVSAAEDDLDFADSTATISHAVAGYTGVTNAADVVVTVDNNDDDTAPAFAGVTVEEQNYTATFNITDLTLPVATGGNGAPRYTLTPDIATAIDGLTFDDTTRIVSGTPSAATAAITLTYTAADSDSNNAAADEASLTFAITVNPKPEVLISETTLTVAEGSNTHTYIVTLTTDPSGEVVVTPTSDNTADVPSPTALTFAATEWNTPQTVTVTANADAPEDFTDERAQITHVVTGYTGVTTAPAVAVTVTDDDTNAVPVFAAAQADQIYTVGVAVDLTLPAVAPATPGNGAPRYTLTPDIATAIDGLTFDDTTRVVSGTPSAVTTAAITLTYTAADSDTNNDADDEASLTFAVTVNAVPAVLFAPTTLTVTEGGTGGYTVELSVAPTTDEVVVTPSAATGLTLAPAALTFTGGNWNTAQDITITTAPDDDAANETLTVSHAVSGAGNYATLTDGGDVTVTVTDDDTPRVMISDATLTVDEGDDDTYTVRLNTQPSGEVTITPSSNNPAVTVSGPLTFTTANWNEEQGVTVTTTADDDATANAGAVISHESTGDEAAGAAEYAAITPIDEVAVTVTETDSVGFTVTPPTLSLSEGNSGFYTVVLTSAPSTGEVTVTPDSADSDAVSVFSATAELVFTSANWNVAQTVSVRGVADADVNDETVTISNAVSVSDPLSDYDGETADDVVVTVDDTTLAFADGVTIPDQTYYAGVTITNLTLPRATGGNGDLTYTLTPFLGGAVPGLRSTDSEDGFWLRETPRTAADAVTLTYTVRDEDGNTDTLTFSVTVREPPVRISPTRLTVFEGGSGAYTVTLRFDPGRDVTITPSIAPMVDGLTLNRDGVPLLPSGALTFTAANWNSAQMVTVAVAAGSDDGTATISHAVSGYGSVTTADPVIVTIESDTEPQFAAGAAPPDQTYFVGENTGRVYLPLANGGNGDLSYTLTPDVQDVVPNLFFFNANLPFLFGNPFRAADAVTLTYTARDADGDTDTLTFSVTVQLPPVQISPTRLSVSEDRARTYNVALTSEPGGEVTVTPSVAPGGHDLTLSRNGVSLLSGGAVSATAALTFTTANWNSAQTVTVTAAAGIDSGTATISHAVSGYDHYTADPVIVTIEPDTAPEFAADAAPPDQTYFVGVQITNLFLPAATGGNGDLSYTLTPDVFAAIPSLRTSTRATGIYLSGTPRSVADAVTLTYTVRDADGDTDTLTFSVTVQVEPAVTISPTTLTVSEDIARTYSVALTTDPGGEVTITPSVAPMGHGLTLSRNGVSLSPGGALTFATGNWNSAQTVTVAAGVVSVVETATISHAVSGYGSVTADSVIVTIEPDTAPEFAGAAPPDQTYFAGVRITNLTLPRTTGGNGVLSYTLTPFLGSVVPGLRGRLGALGAWLYGTPRTVADAVTLTYTVGDADGDTATLTFSVTVLPAPAVLISPTTLLVSEDIARTYSVALTTDPGGEVTITPSVAPMGHGLTLSRNGVSLSPGNALTFTTGNWNSAQTVTVAAGSVSMDSTATISHAVSGYGSVTADSVIVTIEPDTAPEFAGAAPPDQTYTVGVTITNLTLPRTTGGNGVLSYTLTPFLGSVVPGLRGRLGALGAWLYGTPRTVADAVTLTYTVGDEDGDTATLTFSVTVQAVPAVTISPTTLTVTEDIARTYSVALTSNPGGEVTITPSVAPMGHDLTLSRNGAPLSPGGALTFTTANWNSAQTVTVAADVVSVVETATISHAVSGYGLVTADSVIVTIEPDIPLGFAAGATPPDQTYFVGERIDGLPLPSAIGGKGVLSYTLIPDVRFAVPGISIASLRRGGIHLFGTPSTAVDAVTLTYAVRDDDGETDALTFSITVLARPPVRISPGTLPVPDGYSSTFSVQATRQPAGDLVITPSLAPAGHGLTLSSDGIPLLPSGALTFTRLNWRNVQMITVHAAEDDDNVEDTATIRLAVRGFHPLTDLSATIRVVPVLPVYMVPDQTYTAGVQIAPLQLPRRSGTPPVTYTLTPVADIPDGLTFDGNTSTLSGTPTTAADAVTLTYITRDVDGDTIAETLSITVAAHGVASAVTISPTTLTVIEGGDSGAYRVALMSVPSGEVTVTPTATPADNDLTLTPNTALVFTAGNWNTAQEVRVSAAADADGGNDVAIIRHSVSGAGFAGVVVDSVVVTVTDDDVPGVTISETSLSVNESGGVETYTVALNTAPLGNATVTPTSNTAAAIVSPSEPLTFTPANWNTAQTVTVTGGDIVGADDVTGVITHAVSGYGGITTAAPVAVTVRAAGIVLRDREGVEVTRLNLDEGNSITYYTVVLDTLPSANVTVTPLSSDAAVTVSPTGGLVFTPANWNTAQTVDITAAASATIRHAVSATGNYAGLVGPELRVIFGNAEAMDALNAVILPEVAHVMVGNHISAITHRITQARTPAGRAGAGLRANLGGHSTLEELAATHAQTMVDDDFDTKTLLADSDFAMPLNADGAGGLGGSNLALWGSGDYRNIGGDSNNVDWDGSLFSAHLGVDVALQPGLLAGVMLAWSEADLEYTNNTTATATTGDYELDMTSLHPYLGWRALNGRLDMWTTVGYGSGDLKITEANATPATADATLHTLGVGGSGTLLASRDTELRVKGEVQATRLEVGQAADDAFNEMEVSATQTRLALEATRTLTAPNGAQILPSLELGMRYDGGDGATGSGLEIGAGLRYHNATRGLTLETRLRALLSHSGDTKDQGLTATLNLTPGADRQGLSLTLTPAYGNAISGVQNLWDKGVPTADSDSDLNARMSVEVGYGFAGFADGLLTPYSEMTFDDNNKTYRMGMRWNLGKTFTLNLANERLEKDDAVAEDVYLLEGDVKF